VRGSDFLTCTSGPFESIRARVQAARDTELQRFSKIESPNIVANADIRIGEIRQFCKLQDEGQSLMRAATTQLNLSARACHRILKVAWTIADLAGVMKSNLLIWRKDCTLRGHPKLMLENQRLVLQRLPR